jgi:D-glycero-D-manno-heptose 1,7-bisphosphate phosphatase
LIRENGPVSDRAVFLDRDGVINHQRPDHVKSWDEFQFLPGALDALAKLHQMAVRVAVVTNQAVVGRGLIQEADLVAIHKRMTATVALAGGNIERIYACVHAPEAGCACRKPQTALLRLASEQMGIALEGSVLIGDSETDVRAARAVGCLPILVAAPESATTDADVPTVASLAEAVRVIAQLWSRQEVAAC